MEIPSFDEMLAKERINLANESAMEHAKEIQNQQSAMEAQAQSAEANKIISVMIEEKDLVLNSLRKKAPDIRVEYVSKYIRDIGGGRAKYGYSLGWDLKRFVRKAYKYHDGETPYPSEEYIDKSEGLAITTDGSLHFTEDTGRTSGYWFNKYPLHISKYKLIFRDNTKIVAGGNKRIISVDDVRSGLARIKLQEGI